MLSHQIMIEFANDKGIPAYLLPLPLWFLGPVDELLSTLAGFMIISIFVTMLKAVSDKKSVKHAILQETYRIIAIFLLVSMGHFIDIYLAGNHDIFRTVTLRFYIFYKGIDILENAAGLGVPIPKCLVTFLARVRDGID